MPEDLPIEDAVHGAERWRTAVRERPGSARGLSGSVYK
jgi:hypothetical protein